MRILVPGIYAVAFGGTDAAVHWLGGVNTVAGKGVRLIYADVDLAHGLVQGDEVRVVSRDKVAARSWRDGFSSVAQTYADLFAMPGWQASEFRLALHSRLFGRADWEKSKEALASTPEAWQPAIRWEQRTLA